MKKLERKLYVVNWKSIDALLEFFDNCNVLFWRMIRRQLLLIISSRKWTSTLGSEALFSQKVRTDTPKTCTCRGKTRRAEHLKLL